MRTPYGMRATCNSISSCVSLRPAALSSLNTRAAQSLERAAVEKVGGYDQGIDVLQNITEPSSYMWLQGGIL